MDYQTAVAQPPAKLNLFLELLGKRDDGYHEIDTVMVPIAWRDELRLRLADADVIDLSVSWTPSAAVLAKRLGAANIDDSVNTSVIGERDKLLTIPSDERNLVVQALARFRQHYAIDRGFKCELFKSVPAGAGMGGASSNAASALLAAAMLAQIPSDDRSLLDIAASIGSDVPFFMGTNGRKTQAARARGRGEQIHPLELTQRLHFVVIFPAFSVSTAEVYRNAVVPEAPKNADGLIHALNTGNLRAIAGEMGNQLQRPSAKIVSQIDEILKSMWRAGLIGCQLTGSGSACFGLCGSEASARRAASLLRNRWEPGARVVATRSCQSDRPKFVEAKR